MRSSVVGWGNVFVTVMCKKITCATHGEHPATDHQGLLLLSVSRLAKSLTYCVTLGFLASVVCSRL